jgi:hypothetical protein
MIKSAIFAASLVLLTGACEGNREQGERLTRIPVLRTTSDPIEVPSTVPGDGKSKEKEMAIERQPAAAPMIHSPASAPHPIPTPTPRPRPPPR